MIWGCISISGVGILVNKLYYECRKVSSDVDTPHNNTIWKSSIDSDPKNTANAVKVNIDR